MKKNRTMRVAVLMLALTLVTCCFVGSTFAKYTSTSTGTDSAVVAKWAFTIDDDNIVANNTFDFELFTTAYELDGDGNVTSTADDEIVDAREGVVIIAPGCGGSVTVTLTNSSEVDATYAVDYNATEADVPLKWSADNETWVDDPVDIAATAIAAGDDAEITLYYKWDFSTGADTADTTLGAAGTATPSIQAVVTVTQAD